MAFVDLSHPVGGGRSGPGGPPRIGPLVDHLLSGPGPEPGGAHPLDGLATSLHAPLAHGTGAADLGALPLEGVAGVPGIVVSADASRREIALRGLAPEEVRGRAVLVRTGWDARWGTDSYREPGPYLGTAAARLLAEARVVGVDFANVDDLLSERRPLHAVLLRGGVALVEHLTNLRALPVAGFRFHAVPLRVVGGASVPIRAFAELS